MNDNTGSRSVLVDFNQLDFEPKIKRGSLNEIPDNRIEYPNLSINPETKSLNQPIYKRCFGLRSVISNSFLSNKIKNKKTTKSSQSQSSIEEIKLKWKKFKRTFLAWTIIAIMASMFYIFSPMFFIEFGSGILLSFVIQSLFLFVLYLLHLEFKRCYLSILKGRTEVDGGRSMILLKYGPPCILIFSLIAFISILILFCGDLSKSTFRAETYEGSDIFKKISSEVSKKMKWD